MRLLLGVVFFNFSELGGLTTAIYGAYIDPWAGAFLQVPSVPHPPICQNLCAICTKINEHLFVFINVKFALLFFTSTNQYLVPIHTTTPTSCISLRQLRHLPCILNLPPIFRRYLLRCPALYLYIRELWHLPFVFQLHAVLLLYLLGRSDSCICFYPHSSLYLPSPMVYV